MTTSPGRCASTPAREFGNATAGRGVVPEPSRRALPPCCPAPSLKMLSCSQPAQHARERRRIPGPRSGSWRPPCPMRSMRAIALSILGRDSTADVLTTRLRELRSHALRRHFGRQQYHRAAGPLEVRITAILSMPPCSTTPRTPISAWRSLQVVQRVPVERKQHDLASRFPAPVVEQMLAQRVELVVRLASAGSRPPGEVIATSVRMRSLLPSHDARGLRRRARVPPVRVAVQPAVDRFFQLLRLGLPAAQPRRRPRPCSSTSAAVNRQQEPPSRRATCVYGRERPR